MKIFSIEMSVELKARTAEELWQAADDAYAKGKWRKGNRLSRKAQRQQAIETLIEMRGY